MTPIGISVTSELISAISALRTTDENQPDNSKYLDEIYPMVAHAIEHIHSAIEIYNKEQKEK